MKLRKQKQNKTNKSTNTTKRINNTINTNDAIYGSIIGVNCDVDSLCCVGAFVGFVAGFVGDCVGINSFRLLVLANRLSMFKILCSKYF